jgi:plastocyanin
MLKQTATLALAIGLATACGGDGGIQDPPPSPPPPPPSAISVTTGSNLPPRFIPTQSTVAVGGTVTFQSGSPVTHNVTSNTDAWVARTLLAGGSFQLTFATAGDFLYHCTIHDGMTGTIQVR